jgi:outer membrane protein assembly factor BamA
VGGRIAAASLALALALLGAGRAEGGEPPKPDRLEWTAVPVVGGNSDIGYGAGFLGATTRFSPGFAPYRLRLEAGGFITFKKPAATLEVPHASGYVELVLPELFHHRLRTTTRLTVSHNDNLNYFGLGNASPYTPTWEAYSSSTQAALYQAALDFYEYGWTEADLRTEAQLTLGGPFYLTARAGYSQNWLRIPAASRLGEDRLGASGAEVQGLVSGPDEHGVLLLKGGLLMDTRDDEIVTTRGVFHELSARVSPGGAEPLPYRYWGLDLTTRFYVPLAGPRLMLATRFVADALFGHPPVYELYRYAEGGALGGEDGVRGVLGQRFQGKRKVFGNLELRAMFVSFKLPVVKQEMTVGLAGFFDAGRLWADDISAPALDGTRLGLKYGVGGGPRLEFGKSFVLRADVAWSPDAEPIGLYFEAGEVF